MFGSLLEHRGQTNADLDEGCGSDQRLLSSACWTHILNRCFVLPSQASAPALSASLEPHLLLPLQVKRWLWGWDPPHCNTVINPLLPSTDPPACSMNAVLLTSVTWKPALPPLSSLLEPRQKAAPATICPPAPAPLKPWWQHMVSEAAASCCYREQKVFVTIRWVGSGALNPHYILIIPH